MGIADYTGVHWNKISLTLQPRYINIATDVYLSGSGIRKDRGEIYKASEFIKRNNI